LFECNINFKNSMAIRNIDRQTSHRQTNWNSALPAVLIFCLVFFPCAARAAKKQATEYELKMAFLFNFLKYVEWEKEKGAEKTEPDAAEPDAEKEPEPIRIGVVGKDPFEKAWEIVRDKKVNDRKISYRIFDLAAGEEEQQKQMREEIRSCQVLFVPKSEGKNLDRILELVKDCPVLTVGETGDFLQKGGILTFILEENKIRFEINLDTAKAARIQFKTSVLKLAKTIVQKKEKSGK